jgi:threonine aldolase
MDGARIWNAGVAARAEVSALAAPFDTLSVCFSKGLGAPVGSALCGARVKIEEARRVRKRLGGGMRQAGILAAGALHALAHHRTRIAEDHANARAFADLLAGREGIRVEPAAVETNIVNVDLDASAAVVAKRARALGLAVSASGPTRLRAVTHLDVSRQDVERAAAILVSAVQGTS